MNKDYKAKLLEKAGIYVDCCQLLKCVYKLLFSMPKKDRVIIGDKIIEYNLSMIAHFSKGFQFKECRLAEIDSFLFDFDRMKALLRMASELKILLPAKYVLLFEYIERIDEGVAKWRNASNATKSMQSRNQTTSAAMGKIDILSVNYPRPKWRELAASYLSRKTVLNGLSARSTATLVI